MKSLKESLELLDLFFFPLLFLIQTFHNVQELIKNHGSLLSIRWSYPINVWE